MRSNFRLTTSVILLIVVMCLSLTNTKSVFADEGTPTEPPVSSETDTPTEPAVVPTYLPVEATPTPGDIAAPPTIEPVSEAEPVEDLLAQLPVNTDVVILDQNGNPVSLASQDAAEIIQEEDPLWCPVGEPLDSPLCRNFTGVGSVQALIDSMRTDPGTYASDGIIYFTSTVNGSLILSDDSTSLGASFATLSSFNLSLQGGWDGTLSSIANLNGQSNFGGNIISIGTLGNPWIGSLSINNISTLNTTSSTDASLSLNSNGIVELNNVNVAGSGTGQDGISISAPTVNLNNVMSTYHEGNGISIATTSDGGTVTLNNVIASNNGHMNGSDPVGSGVYINGSNTTVNVIGGSFNNNARYGIEALNSNSTTLPAANLWTDTQDYAPGSIVTISGGDNNLNGNNVGFITGETVHVEVTGPNGYTATCEAVADAYGKWSCQITLWSSELALGDYSYTANGLTSGISVSGVFTDARNIQSVTLNGVSTQITVAPGGTITVVINVQTTGSGTANDWLSTGYSFGTSPGAITCVNHADHTSAGNQTETFTIPAPTTPGTYNVYFYAYDDNACSSGQSNLLTLTNMVVVSKITPTLSVTNSPVIYNGSPRTATVTGSVAGTISNIRYNGSATAPTNAAPYAITADFTPTDTTTYNSLTNASAGNFVINKATPILTVTNSPVIYNGSPQAAIVSAGTVAGTVSNITYNFSGTVPTNVNSYAIRANFAPTDTTNYNNLTFASAGNFVINRATPTITFGAAPTPISGSNFSVSATTTNTQSSTLTYSRVSGPCAHIGGPTSTSFSTSGVGTCVVQASGAQTSNFNAASATQSVNISPANTPPVVTVTGVTNGASYQFGSVPDAGCSVVDTQDGNFTFAATLSSITGPLSAYGLGSRTASCAYTDLGGLSASASATYSIIDTIAPVIAAHADVDAEATSATGATVTYTSPVTSDAVSGAGIATCTPSSGSLFPLGNTTVTCNATDAAGNAATPTTFVVHVVDTTAPVIAAHADVYAEAASSAGATVTYTSPATSDAVSGAGTATCTPASGSLFPLGNTTVTCNATDAAGNAATPTTFVVHVVDSIAPVIAAHADVTAEATSALGAIITYTSPSTSDAVDGAGTAACLPASGSQFALGNTTVTCNATDSGGNAAIATSFVVHVVDTTAPLIAPHGDIFANTSKKGGAIINYLLPTTSDIVDGAGVATCIPAPNSSFPVGITKVTCSAVDAHGNIAVPITFVIDINFKEASTGSVTSDLIIPVTGASINLTCVTPSSLRIQTEGARFIFNNLCGYQAFVEGVEKDSLPGKMPNDTAFVGSFTVNILKDGSVVKPLPANSSIIVQFEIPAGQQNKNFAVYEWNGKEWIEVPGQKTADGFFNVTVTEGGTFMFVTK